MAPTFQTLRYDVSDGLGRLTLTRPERGNCLDQQALEELGAVVDLAADDADEGVLRCLLIEAEGRFFCTGGDLRSLGASREGAPAFVAAATVPLNAVVAGLARLGAPVVVAVAGPAVGAGVGFAALADVVVASERATFVAGYPAIGLTPDAGLSWFLPRRVGSRRAADFFLRNRTWTAHEALDLGLVSEVVAHDEVATRAEAVAAELAVGPTAAYARVRALLLASHDLDLETQLELEARTLAAATRTDDGWRGISAALAGEAPTFTGH